MILTVDMGNSRIKRAEWEHDRIVTRDSCFYGQKQPEEVFDDFFSSVQQPSKVYAICVSGMHRQAAFTQWVSQHWQREVGFLQTGRRFGSFQHAYADPARHGVDRWAACIAAIEQNPGHSLCVICAGTAITFDLINKNGLHLGGYIVPSARMMHAALLDKTANLASEYRDELPGASVPVNTADGINSGVHHMVQAGISKFCQLAADRLDAPLQIVLTGGGAEYVMAYSDLPDMQYNADLIMQGLYKIMQQSENSKG